MITHLYRCSPVSADQRAVSVKMTRKGHQHVDPVCTYHLGHFGIRLSDDGVPVIDTGAEPFGYRIWTPNVSITIDLKLCPVVGSEQRQDVTPDRMIPEVR